MIFNLLFITVGTLQKKANFLSNVYIIICILILVEYVQSLSLSCEIVIIIYDRVWLLNTCASFNIAFPFALVTTNLWAFEDKGN